MRHDLHMKTADDYNVRLDIFEGPLDLLLYLVNRAELDIAEISVGEIAKQYLEYLDIMREINIVVASEYLAMAATLVRLKAAELLPDTEIETLEEDEQAIVSREQLVRKLLEYKIYKEAAGSLRSHEAERWGCFSRGRQEEVEATAHTNQMTEGSVSLFDLVTAFKRILERAESVDPSLGHVLQPDSVKIDDRIEHILNALEHGNDVLFETLFQDDLRKIVLVVTFMALLELIKMGRIVFRQEEAFGSLFVRSNPAPRRSQRGDSG